MDFKNLWIILIHRIRKNLIMFATLLIVTTISVFLINIALYEWNRENYNVYITRKILGGDPNLYNISLATMEADEVTENAVETFLNKLPDVEGVVASGRQMSIHSEWQELTNNETFLQINADLFSGTIAEAFPTLINIHCVDKGLLNTFGLTELAGEDVSDSIPVMAGYSYQELFTIGEVYTDTITGCQYRIVGFLPKGFQLPSETPLYDNLYIDADNGMVAMYDDRLNPDYMMTLNACNSMYFISNGSSHVRENVYSLARDCGLYIRINTIEEMISEYKDGSHELITITFLFTGIAVLTGLIATVSASIAKILLNKQEYGIMYACGVSLTDAFNLIALDNGIKLLSSLMLALVITQQYIKDSTLTDLGECLHMFHTKVVPEVMVIVLILWIFSTSVPSYILNKMSVVDLLGENEL